MMAGVFVKSTSNNTRILGDLSPVGHARAVEVLDGESSEAGMFCAGARRLCRASDFLGVYLLVTRKARGHHEGRPYSGARRFNEDRRTAMAKVAEDLLNRAKQEYLEMPGLLLTTRQASRLWNLDSGLCQAVLSALVHEKFLSETHGGAYLRARRA